MADELVIWFVSRQGLLVMFVGFPLFFATMIGIMSLGSPYFISIVIGVFFGFSVAWGVVLYTYAFFRFT